MLKKFFKNLKFLKNYGKVILNAIIIGILIIVLVIFVIKNKEESESFVIENSKENMINMNEENGKNEKKEGKELEEGKEKEKEDKIDMIKVHVDGFVNNPGLIELEEGSRVNDAIEKAGGVNEQGDLSKVNLAYILSDGEKIYIPSIFDEKSEDIRSEEKKNSKVNINSAGEEELKRITGIGDSTARKIIEYRVANGKFNSIEDIKNVSRNRR